MIDRLRRQAAGFAIECRDDSGRENFPITNLRHLWYAQVNRPNHGMTNAMGQIQISIDADANASVFDVRGEVTADDIIAAMNRQYVAGSPRHAVWDYTHAAFHKLVPADYVRISTGAKERAQYRVGGKTAFVAPGRQEAVAVKLLEAMSKVIDLPIPLRICQTRSEATAWLAEG